MFLFIKKGIFLLSFVGIFLTLQMANKNHLTMKTDIEIAHEAKLDRIDDVAASMGVEVEQLEHYGKYIAKLP